tara:strand:+ start:743 stop:1240 length:498 start_codon:yes stop_codon:yes gene_type:complete
MNIKEDLEKGKKGEQMVVSLFKSAGVELEFNRDKSKFKFWDLKSSGIDKQFSIEVKNDIMSVATGNVAIEVSNPRSGKDSGISVTKSDLWVHIVGKEIWCCRSSELKSFVAKNEPFKIVKYAGDGNATIYLYKKDTIMPKIFTEISSKKPKEVISFLKNTLSAKR